MPNIFILVLIYHVSLKLECLPCVRHKAMRERDSLWQYAEDIGNNRVRCRFCEREFAGGNINRLKQHWAGGIKRGIGACTEVPPSVKMEAQLALGDSRKKARIVLAENQDNKTISFSSDILSKDFSQYSLPEIRGKDKNKVDDMLAKFIMSWALPFDIVEASSFIKFLRCVAEYGLNYMPPSCKQLRMETFPRVVEEVEKYMQGVKESWELTGCTIMLDKLCNRIVNIVYARKGAIFMDSFETSEDMVVYKGFVSSQIDQVGVDHVVQIVTNDDEVFCAVRDLLNWKYPKMYQIRCVAYEIHSLSKAIYDEVEWVKVTIDQAALIVQFMYENVAISSLMSKYTNKKELKQPCLSKFASNYQMLQSVSDNKNELLHLIASEEWSQLKCNPNKKAKNITLIIQSSEFWSGVEQVIQVMEPFVQVLRLVEDNRSTSGYLYEAMEKARKAIMQLYSIDSTKYGKIFNLFEERQREKIIHPIHAAAAFLNPAYMLQVSFKVDDTMKEGIQFVLETLLSSDEEKGKFAEEVQLYRSKVSKVFNQMAYRMIEKSHPWIWWEYCGDSLPILQKYAMRILSQPTKCSIYLHCSAFKVKQRKNDDLVARTMNTMIMEKFKTLEETSLQPIDLQNCNELPDYFNLLDGNYGNDPTEFINGSFDDGIKTITDSSFLKEKNGAHDQPFIENWPEDQLVYSYPSSSQIPPVFSHIFLD